MIYDASTTSACGVTDGGGMVAPSIRMACSASLIPLTEIRRLAAARNTKMLEEVKEHEAEYDHGHGHDHGHGGECHDHSAPGHSHSHSHINIKSTIQYIFGSMYMMTKSNPKPVVYAALTSFCFFVFF